MRRFDKQFDLEPTEYRREDEPETFFGFNAVGFAYVFGFTWIIGYCLSWLANNLPLPVLAIVALPIAWVLAKLAGVAIAAIDSLFQSTRRQ